MSIQSVEIGRPCRVFTTLSGLSSAVPCPSPTGSVVIFQPETQSIRWRPDGILPTSSVGFLATAGNLIAFAGDLKKLNFIEVAASATLNIAVFE